MIFNFTSMVTTQWRSLWSGQNIGENERENYNDTSIHTRMLIWMRSWPCTSTLQMNVRSRLNTTHRGQLMNFNKSWSCHFFKILRCFNLFTALYAFLAVMMHRWNTFVLQMLLQAYVHSIFYNEYQLWPSILFKYKAKLL